MTDKQKQILVGFFFGLIIASFFHFTTRVTNTSLKTLLDGYEYRSYDARMKSRASRSEEASIDDVIIIDIEQNSIESLGNYHEWPHAYHGQLIDVVTSGNPDAILFDIIFDEKSADDYYLVDALASNQATLEPALSQFADQFLISHDPTRFIWSTSASPTTYHALVFENSDSNNFLYAMDQIPESYQSGKHEIVVSETTAKHLPVAERIGNTYYELLNASHGAGSANFPQDTDGIIRRAPTAIFLKGPKKVFPSLVLSAVKDILKIPNDGFEYDFDNNVLSLRNENGDIVRQIPIDDQGRMYVNYYGLFKTFYYIPYMYAFDQEMLDPSYWDGKVALVGASLPGLMDLRNTPVQETFAGVEIHANVIHSILQDEFVTKSSKQQNAIVLIGLSILIGIFGSLPKKPYWGFLFLLIAGFVWIIFTYDQFLSRLLMWEVVRPTLSMALTQLSVLSYSLIIMDKDKRFLKNTFGTYISPKLIDQMVESKEEPKLGGNEAVHTAFFTDIESFSTFSEQLSATELVELLNSYLTDMTTILLKNQGTLDKYIGDAIVGFFGAPMPVKDHEYWACVTALEMDARLKELRIIWKNEGARWPDIVHKMQNRIGIHTGPMVTGNMGSTQRMNYTMMGDSVNLTARLESSAKQYGVYIQVSEDTQKAVKDRMTFRALDKMVVLGRSEPIQTFELISKKGQEPDIYKEILPQFHKAKDLYMNKEFVEAEAIFDELDTLEDMFPGRKINPSRVFRERCKHLKQNAPDDDWNGVWTLLSK